MAANPVPLDPTPGAATADLSGLARRLAQAIATAEATPLEAQRRILVFQVGPLRVGLPLTSIREVVVPPTTLSKVPRAPAALLGIMNLRGRVVAVVDLLHALPPGVSPPPGSHFSGPSELSGGRILLLDRGRREVGLLVQAVEGVVDEREGSQLPLILDPEQVAAAIAALVD